MFPTAQAPDEAYLNKMDALGRSLLDDEEASGPHCPRAGKPAGYTYFGQFIDHDLTFDPVPLEEAHCWKPEDIPNGRTPWLDLDQVYGGGPGNSPELYEGETGAERFIIVGKSDLPLGRNYKLIGDQRKPPNEQDFRDLENAILLQFHVLFMRLHNKAIEQHLGCGIKWIEDEDDTPFNKAARLVRWQYQWLVRNDYLSNVIDTNVMGKVQASGPRFKWPQDNFFIPVEFSTAAFRFGHSMVRPSYQLNKTSKRCLRDLLKSDLATKPLPPELVIDWGGRFFGGGRAPFMAIDTKIACDLGRLSNYTAQLFSNRALLALSNRNKAALPSELPVRSLERAAWMCVPSGQQVADALCIERLSFEHLTGSWLEDSNGQPDESGQVLIEENLLNNTPLFYYLLREAETPDNCGNHLGVVGSQIVADVIEGSLRHDPDSYLTRVGDTWQPPLWTDPSGQGKERIYTMTDLIRVLGN